MNRRTLLTAGAVGLAALAGCGGTDSGTDETPTGTDTTTPTTPTMTDESFTVVQTSSGQERDEASVTVDGATVTIEGTIWGADGCTTAELADASYDVSADELTVAVATTQRTGTGTDACTQAIVEIDYRATVTFENGLPGTVVVTHDRGDGVQTVTSTSP
jgi:hypothetical protein